MSAPTVTGIHHIKIPVSDLTAAADWYVAVLGARRDARLDHRGPDGDLYGVILFLPGCATPVELRRAPDAAARIAGFDVVTFGVTDDAELQRWADRLDAHGVAHTPVKTALAGRMVELTTPDGLPLRLYTDPPGGFAHVELDPSVAAEVSR